VVSADVAAKAGVDLSGFPRHEVAIRGRVDPLVVYAIERARDLPAPAGAKAKEPA